jgi:hypothetical protein
MTMSIRRCSCRLALIWLCAAAVTLSAGAHHAATVFDRSKPVIVTGVVKEFRWTSPHAWIYLDVPRAANSPGNAPHDAWAFEGASISVMVRNGWKSNSLRPGDHVRILAAPRKDGTQGGEFLSVTLTESGKVLRLGII